MKLQNPVASLISAPFQNNWNFGISATFLQPFLSYTTKAYTTYAVNTESTYDWQNSQWIVPVNATVSQLLNFGKQPGKATRAIHARRTLLSGEAQWRSRLGTALLCNVAVSKITY